MPNYQYIYTNGGFYAVDPSTGQIVGEVTTGHSVGQQDLQPGAAPQATTVSEPVYVNGQQQPGEPKKYVIVDRATFDGFDKGTTPYTSINNGQIADEAYKVTHGKAEPSLNVLTGQPAPSGHVFQPSTSTSTPQANQAAQQTDQQFNEWLTSQNLTDDQKAALKSVYEAISVNDVARAKQVTEAMAAAAEFSDPYFKAQINLVTDALSRNFASADGDLAFQSQQLQSSLQKLSDDIAASKDHLSFQTQQELQALKRRYEVDIDNTQNAMAATGFTQSTRRAKTEGLITEGYEGAVESSNRQLAFQTGNLNRNLGYAQQTTAAELANLQRLVAEGKIDQLRSAEQQVGTSNLQNLGYSGLLGGQGGEIPRAQVQDMTQFAGQFAF